MYLIIIIILFLFITILYYFSFTKEKKKYEQLKQLQDDEIKLRYRQEYVGEVNKFEAAINNFKKVIKEKEEGIEKLEKEKQRIQNEISEKQNFNNSLYKVREDELNRLIDEKRKEKEKALDVILLKEEREARKKYDKKFFEWYESQEKIKQEYVDNFEIEKESYIKELDIIKNELNEFQAKRSAINEQMRREEELANEIDFHRIILAPADKEDISFLISIEQKINNKEILYKLIWSEYIQKPFNQMIKNICGNNSHKNVIYCIENINNHKKYIGKTSAEVSKRWTEHVKNSLNIGGIKKQLVHEAMFGHWDEFTFSIIEEVQNEKISEREKYYISFFETDKYGYNLKSGG